MRRRTAVLVLAIVSLWSSPARAWDPFRDEAPSEPPKSGREPDPAPFIAPPPGIYYVTDTYVADLVTTSGPVTTYSTTTVHESTGTYARVLDTVGTGAASAFDASAFNGRRALGDGRAVAGTYYENYVLSAAGFVPVSVVFFQDDAEIARLLEATPAPVVTRPAPSKPPVTTPLVPPGCCAPQPPVVTAASPTPAPARLIRPGISLLPVSTPLTVVEVLRGRAVSLYPRAFADERELPVRSWLVVAGDAGEPVATAGSGGTPFTTSWRHLPPPGAMYQLVFRIEVDTPDTGRRTIDAAIAVVVRSPALER